MWPCMSCVKEEEEEQTTSRKVPTGLKKSMKCSQMSQRKANDVNMSPVAPSMIGENWKLVTNGPVEFEK